MYKTESNQKVGTESTISEMVQEYIKPLMDEVGPNLMTLMDRLVEKWPRNEVEYESGEEYFLAVRSLLKQYSLRWNLKLDGDSNYIWIYDHNHFSYVSAYINMEAASYWIEKEQKRIQYISLYSSWHQLEQNKYYLTIKESYPAPIDGQYRMTFDLIEDNKVQSTLELKCPDLKLLLLVKALLEVTETVQPGRDTSSNLIVEPTLTKKGIERVIEEELEWTEVELSWL